MIEGDGAGSGGGLAMTGVAIGARREGRKSGRSRVALRDSSGIAHSGLPLGSPLSGTGARGLTAWETGSVTLHDLLLALRFPPVLV